MKNGIELLFCPFGAITPDFHGVLRLVGQSRATAPGTRRFDDALYSTCTRESAVMMVARPRGESSGGKVEG